MDAILDALSKDKDKRIEEITSVIVITEAADEFPQHIVQKMVDLPNDKRKLLLDVVSVSLLHSVPPPPSKISKAQECSQIATQ